MTSATRPVAVSRIFQVQAGFQAAAAAASREQARLDRRRRHCGAAIDFLLRRESIDTHPALYFHRSRIKVPLFRQLFFFVFLQIKFSSESIKNVYRSVESSMFSPLLTAQHKKQSLSFLLR